MDGTQSQSPAPPQPATHPVCVALLERVRQGTLDLPLLPEAVQRVLEAAGQPHTDAAMLAGIIQKDAALSAQVLKVVNSPLYRGASPIVSLSQAVVRMGVGTLRDVAVVAASQARVFGNPRAVMKMRAMMRHALASAWFAQELARMKRWNVEEAFLAGLVHDLGEAVVLNALLEMGQQCGTPVPAPEVDAASRDAHAPVGAELLAAWKLPARVILSTRHHHAPEEAREGSNLASVVAVADLLSRWALGLEILTDEAVKTAPLHRKLNLYPEDVAVLMQRKKAALDAATLLG